MNHLQAAVLHGARRAPVTLNSKLCRVGPPGPVPQTPQEKPLEQPGAGPPAEDPEEALAKLESRRSTFSLSHLGHFTPSLLAPANCSRENVCPQSVHLYSKIGIEISLSCGRAAPAVLRGPRHLSSSAPVGLRFFHLLAPLEDGLVFSVQANLERIADIAAD